MDRSEFAGDEACRDCHADLFDSYKQHSMGQSLAQLDGNAELPSLRPATFEANGFRYSVRKEGDRWIHHQGRIAGDSEVASIDAVVTHVVGSGNHGQSFLIDRDGHFFMSPITWYPDKAIWDLSPGYEKNNSEFNRPVVEACLYCHANHAPTKPHTLNGYHQPAFAGLAIGCERCHGPGAQHVAQQSSDSPDLSLDSIVNPAKLEPALCDAICQQCHLAGVARVAKAGKRLYDFRPGQPLESAYTAFNLRGDLDSGSPKFVGHFEQMHASRCFQASDGALGCTSCHDPHRLPDPTERVAFYRQRCLDCHSDAADDDNAQSATAEQGKSPMCSVDVAVRTQTSAQDSCIDCHMPKQETEIRHAATTDHAVPRVPSRSRVPPPRSEDKLNADNDSIAAKHGLPFEAFPSDAVAKPTDRDQAIAFVRVAGQHPELTSPEQFEWATKVLERQRPVRERSANSGPGISTASNAFDFEAMEALADLYLSESEFAKAMDVCQQVLDQRPDREESLVILAGILSKSSNAGQAIATWTRVIEVNPWISRYWYELGQIYARTNQWHVCRQTLQEAKRRFPTSIGVRHLLVESNLQLDDHATAEKEFAELRQFKPRGFAKLNDWFQNHPRRKTSNVQQ